MARQNVSSGSQFEADIGYSRAVVVDDWVMVSGCTGYNYETSQISLNIIDQAEQTLQNISSALEKAGASMADIVRVTYILPDKKEFPKIWPILRKWFGDVRPAATMIQAELMEEVMRIEIEVTAKKNSS
ncbi:endoribonuclease L-PSP [Xylogone sp. PMI_703]|nr:endoribonuclease L-PSP [Xylogone sp. PMI_703]